MSKENYALKKYMEVDKAPELRDRNVWTGIYRGIRYEINNFRMGDTDFKNSWTHYILIWLDEQLSKEKADLLWLEPQYLKFTPESRERRHYNYYDSAVNNIEFHGGCTFYEKETRVDDKNRIVKIGCDYQHLFDMNKSYDLDYVYLEVKSTIDSFIKHFGPIKIRSWGDGKYRLPEEFE